MRFFKKHTEPANPIALPDTYDPEHAESGATTAEYGLLAGGVMLAGGVLYKVLTSPIAQELIEKIIKLIFELLSNTISDAVNGAMSGAISLPGLFF